MHPFLQAIQDSGISGTTKELYFRNLKTIATLTGKSDLSFIFKPNKTYKIIEKHWPNIQTRRSVIIAIKSIFRHLPELKCQHLRASERWHELYSTLHTAMVDRVMRGEPTDRERRNWVRWKDVVEKERELARTEYASQRHLLLAMYTLIEPGRQDYHAVALYNDYPRDMTTGNFVVIPLDANAPATLVLNEYKTKKSYGQYIRTLPMPLTKIIHESLRQRPRFHLFAKQENGEPHVDRHVFTRYVNNELERLFEKRFTVGMMRHSFISEGVDYNKSTPGQLFQTAANMHHSIAQQQQYRRQVPPTGEETSDDDDDDDDGDISVSMEPSPKEIAPPVKAAKPATKPTKAAEKKPPPPPGYIDVSI